MPTYIHLVRHAQGFHNLTPANHALPDPDLTPLGREQCAQLQRTFPLHAQVTHIVASPLRRTLYTALLSFAPVLTSSDKQVTAVPDLQEVAPLPCDIGSSPQALAVEFGPAGQVDLRLVTEGWNDKESAGSPYVPTVEKLEARARRARVWMRELGRRFEAENPGVDAHIVAVTHGGFLHFLTQDWDGADHSKGTGWDNTEWRSYEFAGGDEDEEARLRETERSWRRRRGSEKGLTETEQMELRAALHSRVEREWGNLGQGKVIGV
ncbi:uncharacterized protein THITE_2109686 [Thermothielavioides terrestris NRRL 8126]|jgi:broad specificity phosphatase PhoE|uniref:Phosphoglycerate mutase-like protein n=1 Tax=Thermothielavioides terrestris (strain ATCC 38088 / NRRL 8126) TaxID=578455 RepID=G2QXJ0_THETT|nr:uncharacterized protein THITE_2109686 [Thermothielavioides terrestris NRRL 8126]AEO64015.1 hypothetical protein THITE_2109686 [Thermothielavioides terrestris NRRL 8126]